MAIPFVAAGREPSGVAAEIAAILYRSGPEGLRPAAIKIPAAFKNPGRYKNTEEWVAWMRHRQDFGKTTWK